MSNDSTSRAALDENAVMRLFEETGALLHSHFLLTSGLHSPNYLQCARVLQGEVDDPVELPLVARRARQGKERDSPDDRALHAEQVRQLHRFRIIAGNLRGRSPSCVSF